MLVKDKLLQVSAGNKTISSNNLAIAENQQKVYNAGKKAEHDEFWDAYQYKKGEPQRYRMAFSGCLWNRTSFKPKYNIVPTDAVQMFMNYGIDSQQKPDLDLVTHLNELGVTLDFSQCTGNNMSACFSYACISRVGEVNAASATELRAFTNSYLVTIDKIIAHENLSYTNCFQNCTLLENVIFEGVIGKNTLDLQWSTKLSKVSIESIINCLSTTTTGLTVTLSKTAVNNAFETSTGAGDGSTSTEWTTLIATKSNWTISLV